MVATMPGPRVDDLRTIPLFRGFTDPELVEVGAQFRAVERTASGVLFEIDEPARGFFLLGSGEVTLERPGDDVYRLRPPALIGELGGLAGLGRNCRAVMSEGAEVWLLESRVVQAYFAEKQELGIRFLVNLLEVVADKIHRDQRRLEDMRGNLVRTQKELKRVRGLVLDAPDTPLSAPVHDALEELIVHNRRVNYRVEPPQALASSVRVDAGVAQVIEWSRTHASLTWPAVQPPAKGSWISGVADLAGAEIPVSGKVIRSGAGKVTFELDLLIEEYATIFEGYLTRVQLLDILV